MLSSHLTEAPWSVYHLLKLAKHLKWIEWGKIQHKYHLLDTYDVPSTVLDSLHTLFIIKAPIM